MVKESRFYVVFADGSWRTASNDQWKAEQLWKLKPVRSFWFGGADALQALEFVWARYLDNMPPEIIKD